MQAYQKQSRPKIMEEERGCAAVTRPFVLTKPPSLPLHSQHFSRRLTTFNRLFAAVYGCGVLALFYHHLASLLNPSSSLAGFFISLSLFISDVVLAFAWVYNQSFRMNPLRRREFPENLKEFLKDSEFPTLDVFVCTADPYKEPPMTAVNTALSVMAYDYPAGKISVYVSDDGGSAMTLFALMEAARFAGHWLPFCKKNDIVERNPDTFFASNQDWNSDTEKMKIMYEKMKMKVENVLEKGKVGDEFINGEEERMGFEKWIESFTRQHHPTVIQVLLESSKNKDITGEALPNLIYVSRQKSVTAHHHFKAGALNALLRVSAVMTNAPIVLTLDCDTYSNDPQALNRALCYISDPKLNSDLGYVQFPQRFHGLGKNDIYASELKRLYILNPIGMDGLSGPCYVGSGCFFVRRVFFGGPLSPQSLELPELGPNHVVERPIMSPDLLALAHLVAGCDYENGTKWGSKVGFRYGSLVEDYFTGYHFHTEGWKSVFCNPKRAAFYGDAPISLLDAINQLKRSAIGLLQVTFSKYIPITYGVRSMGLLMGLSYSHNAFWTFWSIPVAVYAFLPQLALINAVSIFPKVSDPWFLLYAFLILGAYAQDMFDFLLEGGTFRRWWNDQRMWSVRALSSYLFGSIEFALNCIGISANGFNVTSKVVDREQSKRYEQELFEFGASSVMFLPLALVATINLACFASGLIRTWRGGAWEEMFVQLFVTGFVVVNCWPVYEAMALRSDGGKIPANITFSSVLLGLLLYSLSAFYFQEM